MEDESCLPPGALPGLGCPHFPPLGLPPLPFPPDMLNFPSFPGLSLSCPGCPGSCATFSSWRVMFSFPTQGCSSGRDYLAVQGPDKLTMEDFWTLVWEQDVHTILTLLPWQEKGEVRHHARLLLGRTGICLTELEARGAPKLGLSFLKGCFFYPEAYCRASLADVELFLFQNAPTTCHRREALCCPPSDPWTLKAASPGHPRTAAPASVQPSWRAFAEQSPTAKHLCANREPGCCPLVFPKLLWVSAGE